MMILITAFEPFGEETVNTSAEVMKLLPDQIRGHEVRKLLLPVVFGKAAGKVLSVSADHIFLLGEAGSRTEVTPEMLAKNIRNARIPDNEGNQPENEKIRPAGPDDYQTGIPVRSIVNRMQSEGYPIAVSEDAGTYVCNDTFYLVGVNSTVPVAFIHVPHRTESVNKLSDTVLRYIELAV